MILPGPPIRDVTLRELLEAMAKYPDDAAFRWFQMSVVDSDGVPRAADTLRVSMRQARLRCSDDPHGSHRCGMLGVRRDADAFAGKKTSSLKGHAT